MIKKIKITNLIFLIQSYYKTCICQSCKYLSFLLKNYKTSTSHHILEFKIIIVMILIPIKYLDHAFRFDALKL